MLEGFTVLIAVIYDQNNACVVDNCESCCKFSSWTLSVLRINLQ
jgi:hypothetical protein